MQCWMNKVSPLPRQSFSVSSTPYTLKTCSGSLETSGRRATNFIIESMDGKLKLTLPSLIECDMVPDDRTEIPSLEVVHYHPHLWPAASQIPPVHQDAPILLLLGKDLIRVHKVREQINGPHSAPYAQWLDLGSLWGMCAWAQFTNHQTSVFTRQTS